MIFWKAAPHECQCLEMLLYNLGISGSRNVILCILEDEIPDVISVISKGLCCNIRNMQKVRSKLKDIILKPVQQNTVYVLFIYRSLGSRELIITSAFLRHSVYLTTNFNTTMTAAHRTVGSMKARELTKCLGIENKDLTFATHAMK